jgi:hypothetical protein
MERLAALVPRPRLHLIRFHAFYRPMRRCAAKSFPLRQSAPAHDLGPAAQTGLRHRHRTLPELRRRFEDHRRSFDTLRTEDPPVIVKILRHLGRPTRVLPPACAGASSRPIPNDLRSRKPPANASRRRRSVELRASGAIRDLSRASQPLSGRADRHKGGFFMQQNREQKRELTSLPALRYSSANRKVV